MIKYRQGRESAYDLTGIFITIESISASSDKIFFIETEKGVFKKLLIDICVNYSNYNMIRLFNKYTVI